MNLKKEQQLLGFMNKFKKCNLKHSDDLIKYKIAIIKI